MSRKIGTLKERSEKGREAREFVESKSQTYEAAKIAAFQDVCNSLKSLTKEERVSVIRAVCQLYGIEHDVS